MQRDSIPKLVPSTVDKFFAINYDLTKKEHLIKQAFGTKDKKLMKKTIASLIDEIHRIQHCERAQMILLNRENILTKNFKNESDKHIEKFTEFIYSKYNFFARIFRDSIVRPFQVI